MEGASIPLDSQRRGNLAKEKLKCQVRAYISVLFHSLMHLCKSHVLPIISSGHHDHLLCIFSYPCLLDLFLSSLIAGYFAQF
jgi:hypothetical protein